MKKITRYFAFILLIIYSVNSASVYAASKALPDVEAHGAILMDYKTGRVLWEKNGYAPLPMASTTKIMTAMITLENADINDMVTVSKRAAAAPKVKMELSAGEKIKLEYLLYALMLQSSNDAAVAIAEHVGGTVEDFCRMMTDKARQIGAKDTVFETPNGLDQGEHHSTAYDMAMIARYALNNEKFVKLINTQSVTAESSRRTYSISNKNRLLHEYEGATGVKTGFTGKAGHCFVGAAKRGDMQLISVVLASGWGDKGKEQKWRDTKAILNYGFKNISYQDIVKAGEHAADIGVGRSKTEQMSVFFEKGLQIPLSANDQVDVKINVPENVAAPVKKGETLGTADVYINNGLYTHIALVTEDGVERHDLKTSLEKVLNGWFSLGTNHEIRIELPEIFPEYN